MNERTGIPLDTVQVWWADLSIGLEQVPVLLRLLDDEERQRASRFRFQDDHRSFVVSHAFLRQVLGFYLGVLPGDVRFRRESTGKPALTHPTPLQFNFSHSGNVAVVAVTQGRSVGIHVDLLRELPDLEQVAGRYFSTSEVQRVLDCSGLERLRSFYQHWTAKEAYLKARGNGLSTALDSFEILFHATGSPAILGIVLDGEPGRWALHSFQPREDFVCSVVSKGNDWHLLINEWVAFTDQSPSPLDHTR
jgi:4'-phosphopantetheinyl transferase